jgi:SAM-dependent methyltransferase
MATTIAAGACRERDRPIREEEYRPFPDVGRRNAWQELFEVRALVRLLGLRRGGRVLEVGCGRGVALPVLAQELAPARLTGLDIDPALLPEACARLDAARRSAELVPGDVRALPFPPESFDLVVDFGTCYHVARREAALREVARVLRPGGVFVHETPACQRLSHPVRASGRALPWAAVPELRPARSAVLWASRVKAGLARAALALALVLAAGVPASRAQAPGPSSEPGAGGPGAPASVDAGPTRLFFAPTARSFAAGQGAAGLTEIAFPWLEAGFGHGASVLLVGLPPLEGLVSGGIVVGPKFQLLSKRKVGFAAGVLHALQAHQSVGVAYTVISVGGAKGGLTAGLGDDYGDRDDSAGSRAVVFLGVDRAIGRSFGVVFEGWIGGQSLGLPEATLTAALRLGRRRWSAEVGVVVPVYETGSGTPFPVLTVARRF